MLRLGIAPREDECYIIGRPNKGAEFFWCFTKTLKNVMTNIRNPIKQLNCRRILDNQLGGSEC